MVSGRSVHEEDLSTTREKMKERRVKRKGIVHQRKERIDTNYSKEKKSSRGGAAQTFVDKSI